MTIHQRAVGDFQIAQLHRDLQHVFHAPARDGDLAAVFVRGRDDALQAEGVGGEGRDDDALDAARELPVEAVGDDALGRRKARTLDVGRVA